MKRRRFFLIVAVIIVALLVSSIVVYQYLNRNQTEIVIVQYVMLHQNYTNGLGACFSPVGFIVGSRQQLNGSDNFSEYLRLYDTISNVKCNLTAIYLMSSLGYPNNKGFRLLSYYPNLPIGVSPGSLINITLIIQSPSHAFNGWIDLGLNLTAAGLP